MNHLFIKQDDDFYISELGMEVPELRTIVEKYPDSHDKYISYIYHMCSPTSAYADYGPTKEPTIIQDYLPEHKTKRIPKVVSVAMDKVNSFKSAELRLLEATLEACDKLGDYLRNVNFSEVDDNGRLMHSPTQVMNSLGRIGNLVEGVQKVREQVKKGLQSDEEFYGNRELNMFDQETNADK
jgi:hypothetical protein